MKERKTNLRIGKETFGTKDITEIYQRAFEPYFKPDHTFESIIEEIEEEKRRNER